MRSSLKAESSADGATEIHKLPVLSVKARDSWRTLAMKKIKPLNFTPLPADYEDWEIEDGLTLREAKRLIQELNGVPEIFRGSSAQEVGSDNPSRANNKPKSELAKEVI